MTKFFFSQRGIDYDVNGKVMWGTVKSSVPFDPTGLADRNTIVAAGLAYFLNYDAFRGELIFKKPRGWENKEILPEVEGINDDNVNNLFKKIAPALGMSPIKTQAMVEKIITSENTNPTISLLYATANGLFNEGNLKEDFSTAMDEFLKNAERKMIRSTNKKLLDKSKQEEIAAEVIKINSDKYVKITGMYDEIDDIYDDGKTLTNQELLDMVVASFGEAEAETYFNKYNAYIGNRSIDKRLLNIVYERDPELQSLYLYERYGTRFEQEELNELNNIMKYTKRRISDATISYYNERYYQK